MNKDAFWERLNSSSYIEKQALAQEAIIHHPTLLAEQDVVFELFYQLYEETAVSQEWQQFEEVITLLKTKAPTAYDAHKHYLLDWLITNTLNKGATTSSLQPLFNEMAQNANQELDTFRYNIKKLAYHGHLSVLLPGMRLAWPYIQQLPHKQHNIIEKVAQILIDYEIFALLDQHPNLTAKNDDLQKRLALYFDTETTPLQQYLDYITGRTPPHWSLDEMRHTPAPTTGDQPPTAHVNLFYLTVSFLSYLHHQENIPYSKGEAARQQLYYYLSQRSPNKVDTRHPLLPDIYSLDQFLGQYLHNIAGRHHYTIAAFFELLPAWTRFLKSIHLLSEPQAQGLLQTLTKLAQQLHTIWTHTTRDFALRQNMAQWATL